MLTGRQVFRGELMSDVMASVLKSDPDYKGLPPTIHPKLRDLLRRCLEKEPKQRWHDVGDVRIEVGTLLLTGESQWVEESPSPRPTKRESLAWGLALALLITLVIGSLYERPVPRNVSSIRFAVTSPEDSRITNVQFAISPDRQNLVYVVIRPTGRSLSIRQFDSMESRRLGGTEDAGHPFWSPDSRFIGFSASGLMKKIDVLGGPPETITESVGDVGTWNRGGDILFPKDGIIHKVGAAGGPSTPVTSIDGSQGIGNHGSPYFLPDGNRFLYLARADGASVGSIFVGTLDGEPSERLVNADSKAEYAAGHLIFMREDTLLAQSFDPDNLQARGEPFAVLSEPVRRNGRYGGFSLSDGGSLVYNPGVLQGQSNAYWVDRTGNETFLFGPGRYGSAAVSPDGSQVAVTVNRSDRTSRIWLFDSDNGTPQALATEGDYRSPVWSPDGSRIALASGKDIYWMPADGSEPPELLWTSDYSKRPLSWSSNDELAFGERNPETGRDIWVHRDGTAEPLLDTRAVEVLASFSPDGGRIAYQSDGAIYVQRYPGTAGPVQIGLGEFERNSLLWASNGRELFYRDVEGLVVANLKMDGRIEVESTEQVFSDAASDLAGIHPLDDRFLIFREVDEADGQLHVVLNWFEELKERVPVP